ncbi:hypothetical protein VUR80DRAFT_9949 [Thermomyces stellatus]
MDTGNEHCREFPLPFASFGTRLIHTIHGVIEIDLRGRVTYRGGWDTQYSLGVNRRSCTNDMAFYSGGISSHPSRHHLRPHLHQLRNARLNHLLNSLPSHNKDVPFPPLNNGVLVRALPANLGVAQKPHEDGGLGVRAVDHARVARRVVEVAELWGQGGEERG